MPEWLTPAWEVTENNTVAANALTAYYQGTLIQQDHPSLALLAFVASIEAIGKSLDPTERWNRQRFVNALQRITSGPELDVLAEAYSDGPLR